MENTAFQNENVMTLLKMSVLRQLKNDYIAWKKKKKIKYGEYSFSE